MRTLVEPPLSEWKLPSAIRPRHELARLTQTLRPDQPVVATGHQAWLWHPGILAKDIAAAAFAVQHGAQVLHVVVDQDVHEALQLELPLRHGNKLSSRKVRLAPELTSVPSGCQAPAEADVVVEQLYRLRAACNDALTADLAPLIAAFEHLPPAATLAEQLGIVTQRLMRPYTGEMPLLMATSLPALPQFPPLVRRMLEDAQRCVQAYNRAAAALPEARVAPLIAQRERVELPLWLLDWRQPRRRVFADLADRQPALALEDGELLDLEALAGEPALDPHRRRLAPRALLMTALLRSACCDLFIHGKGGGIYDRITEVWWRQWTDEALAPMAIVSADLYLDFDAPLADAAQVQHAVWRVHHLPHNMDRQLPPEPPEVADCDLAQRKRWLLAHMHDDRDRCRRRAAFEEIHRINARLVQRHPQTLRQAQQELARARQGLANQSVAQRRDWCLALYPPEKLRELVERFQ